MEGYKDTHTHRHSHTHTHTQTHTHTYAHRYTHRDNVSKIYHFQNVKDPPLVFAKEERWSNSS